MIGAALLQQMDARLRRIEQGAVRYRQGVVADDSPLTVKLGGSDVAISASKIASVGALAVGDVVSVLAFGNDVLVVGAIGTPVGFTKLGDFDINSTSLDYSSIPGDYTHLRIVAVCQSSRSGYANTGQLLRINGASASYSRSGHYTAASSGSPVGFVARGANAWYLGQVPAGNRTDDNYTVSAIVDLPFYSRTDTLKTYMMRSAGDDGTNALSAVAGGAYYGGAGAITSIKLIDDVSSSLGPRARAELWASG